MSAFSARSFWLPVMTAALVAAFFGALIARRGQLVEKQLQRERALRQELQELKAENERLRARRDALLSSPEAIERVAREEYGFTAPGEQAIPVDEPGPTAEARIEPPSPQGGVWRIAWRDVPLFLTASVFIVTALLFAALNLLNGRQTEA